MSNNINYQTTVTITTELYDPCKDYSSKTTVITYHEGYPWTRFFRRLFRIPTPYTIVEK